LTWLLCDYGEVLSMAQPAPDRAALERVARRFGSDFWADYWRWRPGYDRGDISGRDYWRAVLGRSPSTRQLHELFEVDSASWVHPNLDSLAAAQRAAQRGLRLALFSNAPVEVAARIDSQDWLANFSPRLYSCALRAVKPEPVAYQAALSALGAAPSDVIFFDDRPANVVAAQQAGIRAEVFTDPRQIDAIPASA
jgi:putative hydrolase of the HAD superfamily